MLTLDDVALFRHFPGLRKKLAWVRLGHWPTPVQPLPGLPGVPVPVHVKREDLSSPRYGGNKVRTLEAIMGLALETGARRIWATGALGSNHATATALHAAHVGLEPALALFPQPETAVARANLAAMLTAEPPCQPIRHAVELPLVMARLRRREHSSYVMPPGGAIPRGTLGAMSAALELAEQVAAGECPPPSRIVLAVGSTCTTAGLLVGVHLARALDIAFRAPSSPPRVTAVRVTPWPITSAAMIARLAYQASRYVARLTGVAPPTLAQLRATLSVDRRFLGGGYGRPTLDGLRAQKAFRDSGGPPLDFVYSAKSGAALLDIARHHSSGPLLFWATKSSAPLPQPRPEQLVCAPEAWRRWLGPGYEWLAPA